LLCIIRISFIFDSNMAAKAGEMDRKKYFDTLICIFSGPATRITSPSRPTSCVSS
jgi:hypothetical protein